MIRSLSVFLFISTSNAADAQASEDDRQNSGGLFRGFSNTSDELMADVNRAYERMGRPGPIDEYALQYGNRQRLTGDVQETLTKNFNSFAIAPGALRSTGIAGEIVKKGVSEAIKEVGRGVIYDNGSEQVEIRSETFYFEGPSQEIVVPFSATETQLQSSLARQTTGLASPIGPARMSRSPDPELERILSSEVRSPFVATVETPSTQATGNFTGDEGLNVAGILNVFAFDSGNLQDGDRVRLTVRDSRGVILRRNVTLTFGGRTSRISARRGLVNVTITALNQGDVPPNTGGLRVSGDVAGSRSRNFLLQTGSSGTIAVRVLGN